MNPSPATIRADLLSALDSLAELIQLERERRPHTWQNIAYCLRVAHDQSEQAMRMLDNFDAEWEAFLLAEKPKPGR